MSIRSETIKKRAKKSGFAYCGIAKVETLDDHRKFYSDFIQKGGHLSFKYLETNLEKRLDPKKVMDDALSVITVLENYYPEKMIAEENNFILSKYAYGSDYPPIIKKKILDLISSLKEENQEMKTQTFVDSGAILEKVWAQKCGVGWQGKNSLLINKTGGSFFFIGIILTNLDLEPDQPETDHCGSCTKCLDTCPTGALSQAYHLNISRCISYHTIENKNEIPQDLKDLFKDRIYGCDICQDVCPYNKFAVPHREPGFTPKKILLEMRKKDWLALTETQFNELFGHSPVRRTGYKKLMATIRSLSVE